MRSSQDLLDELNASDESQRIEAKRCRELSRAVMETVVSFANEPDMGGGWLLLGVESAVNEKGDAIYWPAGIANPDKMQKDLATQCSSMLNVALRPEIRPERLGDKTVLVVFVPEASVAHKPVYFKADGLPKGAWRRIGSTDQRCTDEDLWVLRGESQPKHAPDFAVVPDARMDDFDPAAIEVYRRERVRANREAEEVSYPDEELLESVGAVRRVDGELKPTLAGIVLFGKSMALRRLMPSLRIDYIRVAGTEWMQDPEHRFHSIDIRKPLMFALPLAEASIMDELPRGFFLPEGDLQSKQEPLLPRKMVREALCNQAMHRNYQEYSPSQVIRYSNRIDIQSPGYALKDVSQLGVPGSRLRNPTIAAVLHDLNWAEAKGTGIRTMRRVAADAGLPLPEFHSSRQNNDFRTTLFIHHFLTEEDHAWLKSLTLDSLSADEAKVLIYARETEAVDNAACRDFSGLGTLQASAVLRRLRDRGLLEKQGGGNRTYYTLSGAGKPSQLGQGTFIPPEGNLHSSDEKPSHLSGETFPPQERNLATSGENLGNSAEKRSSPQGETFTPPEGNLHSSDEKPSQFDPETFTPPEGNLHSSDEKPSQLDGLLARLSEALARKISERRGRRSSERELQGLVLELCREHPFTTDELVLLLRKHRNYLLQNHIRPLVRMGKLTLRYPESPNHPHQAYQVDSKRRQKLKAD